VLADLAPPRRRFLLAIAVAVLLAVGGTAAGVLLSRDAPVHPVAQDELGTVLLVPGYGGNTSSLKVLAATLEREGRTARIVPAPGDGRGDLRRHAVRLGRMARGAVAAGAPSVDVVGFSAGGVVARLWVDELDGGSLARRVVTLGSPHHGTDLAGVARGLSLNACPEACRQLAPGSDLLRGLNARDETPDGPLWVALWTTDDQTVVPPTSGSLEGALDFSVQSVCPALHVAHTDLPRTPAVMAMVVAELGTDEPAVPDASVCVSR